MNRRRPIAVLTLLVLAVATYSASVQAPVARAAMPSAAASAPVATVGGLPIAAAEFDQRAQVLLADFARRQGSELPAEMRDRARRQVLEGLINSRLLLLEAKRLGIAVSAAEAEALLREAPTFNPGGRFDAARYDAVKTTHPTEFATALLAAREQIAARKLSAETERRMSPPDSGLRAAATRALKLVTLDMLPLRIADFEGAFEQPREFEVEAWYRTHSRDYEREARSTLTLVFVNSPVLVDSLKRKPSAVESWDQRMRAEAERIIAQVAKGSPLDSVAVSFGLRGDVVVETANFPGYWHGTAAQSARIFESASVGHVLPEPVRAADGWLVVRVDQYAPAHLAPLREVSRDIRVLLRKERALHRDEDDRRALYGEIRDSLSAPGWPIRFAAVDTALVSVPEPGPQDLDTYFRAHLADYARFDSKSGGIVASSLPEVVGDVRRQYLRERRQLEARATCDRLRSVWQSGGRDTGLEARLGARLTPAAVFGSRIDTGFVAGALSEKLWSLPNPELGGVVPYERGFIVWQGLARVDHVTPTFGQAQGILTERLEQRRANAEATGARALFDANPNRFRRGDILHFTRVAFGRRPLLGVTLTHEEVEKWHRTHLDRYSVPEMVSVRHIQISPANKTAAADQLALEKAREILRRIQGGENFSSLALVYSDDAATRESGGDLGSLGHGAMLEDIEKVVFTLPAGTLYNQPVRTELGYHVVEVTEHLPAVMQPLSQIYATVSYDAAVDKAQRLSLERADSLLRAVKNPRTFAEAGRRAGATILNYDFGVYERMDNSDAAQFFAALCATAAGHIVPGAFPIKGQGTWLAVVDSITPSRPPTWDTASKDAIAQYRLGAGRRAIESKCAELDSMLAGGMSFDSLGAYWGGLLRVTDHAAGRPLLNTDTSEELDSLLLGGHASQPGIPVGKLSDWVSRANRLTRVRVVSRSDPSPTQIAERAQELRTVAVQQKLSVYFVSLKARYPVVILDRQMRGISLSGVAPAAPEH